MRHDFVQHISKPAWPAEWDTVDTACGPGRL